MCLKATSRPLPSKPSAQSYSEQNVSDLESKLRDFLGPRLGESGGAVMARGPEKARGVICSAKSACTGSRGRAARLREPRAPQEKVCQMGR
eukprot:1689522-Pyramimonas_sp.AAC.1